MATEIGCIGLWLWLLRIVQIGLCGVAAAPATLESRLVFNLFTILFNAEFSCREAVHVLTRSQSCIPSIAAGI